MSGQVKKVLSPLKPLCNVVKKNNRVLTTLLFVAIALHMLPLDLFMSTSVRDRAISTVNRGVKSPVGRILVFLLFICLYVNVDIENMVLLLYVLFLLRN